MINFVLSVLAFSAARLRRLANQTTFSIFKSFPSLPSQHENFLKAGNLRPKKSHQLYGQNGCL